jgi:hypothetical protein
MTSPFSWSRPREAYCPKRVIDTDRRSAEDKTMRYAWFALAAVTLLLVLASALYAAGPAEKKLKHTTFQPRHCSTSHYEYEPWSRKSVNRCDSWERAGDVTYSTVVRTSAWERISGALTG